MTALRFKAEKDFSSCSYDGKRFFKLISYNNTYTHHVVLFYTEKKQTC